MNDTSPEMEAWLLQKYMERSYEERFKMAAEMFDCARAIMISSLPPGLSDLEKRRMIYERTYGEPAGDWLK
ncbi:MAG TPA: hypothetical protein VKX17_01490 [Planctomycetota bacterium]|nr:hypothetical protein [Planctomycetota bacterium]